MSVFLQAPTALKTSFSVEPLAELLYTGGDVELIPGSRNFACVCGNDAFVVSLDAGKPICRVDGDGEIVTSLSASAEYIALSSRSCQTKLFHLGSSVVTRRWRPFASIPVLASCFSPSATLFATGSSDKGIKVWDIEENYLTHLFKHVGDGVGVITALRFHPDAARMLLFSTSGVSVKVWDLVSKTCVYSNSHAAMITGMSLDPTGWYLATGSLDETVMVHDLRSHNCRHIWPTFSGVKSLVSSGEDMLIASEHGGLRCVRGFWSHAGGKSLPSPQAVADASEAVPVSATRIVVRLAAAAELFPLCLAVSEDHVFALVDCAAAPPTVLSSIVGYLDEVLDITMLESQQMMAIATNSEDIKLRDMSSGSMRLLCGHADMVMCLVPVRVGNREYLLSGSKDNSVRLWSCSEMALVSAGNGHTGTVTGVAASRRPGSASTVVYSVSEDLTLRIWDVSSDGVLQSRGMIVAHERLVNAVALAPNDSVVATASQDKTVKLWDASSQKLLAVCRGHRRGVWCVAFSPVEKIVVSGSSDRTVRCWSAKDGTCLRTLEGFTSGILRVLVVSTGTQILCGNADGVLQLATIKSQEICFSSEGHDGKIWALASLDPSGAGNAVVSGGTDSRLLLWRNNTEELVQIADIASKKAVLNAQELQICLRKGEFSRALLVALRLDDGNAVYDLLERWSSLVAAPPSFVETVRATLTAWLFGDDNGSENKEGGVSPPRLLRLLEFARDWNVTARKCRIAHLLLNAVFRLLTPADLRRLDRLSDLLEGLLSYSSRHYARWDRVLEQSFLVPFFLRGVNKVEEQGTIVQTEGATGEALPPSKKRARSTISPSPEALPKQAVVHKKQRPAVGGRA